MVGRDLRSINRAIVMVEDQDVRETARTALHHVARKLWRLERAESRFLAESAGLESEPPLHPHFDKGEPVNEPLRKCPTCLTPVAEARLGLRDYRWSSERLPGRVAPMDLDFILERNGRFLVQELKPLGLRPGTGQLRTLRALENLGMDVWVVQGDGDEVVVEDLRGVRQGLIHNEEDLGEYVVDWFQEAGAPKEA